VALATRRTVLTRSLATRARRRPLWPVALLPLVVVSGCSPRPAPLAAHVGPDGRVEVLLPSCELGTSSPVLLDEVPREPGDASVWQSPDLDGLTSVVVDAELDEETSYQLSLARTDLTFDLAGLAALPAGEVLWSEGPTTEEPITLDRFEDEAEAFCDAERRDELVVLGLLAVPALFVLVALGVAVRGLRRGRIGVPGGALLVLCGPPGWVVLALVLVRGRHLAGTRRR
jgi:hypothetical protein